MIGLYTMSDRPICDYEGSTYRTDFWEDKGRDYEDQVERRLLRRLLPAKGRRLLEVGGGFGRLTNEFHMYEQVVLLDYSFSQLQYARQRMGDERIIYVAADAYHLPFRPASFDAVTMIRVIHHFVDVPALLMQIQQVMAKNGVFILEYANKRNLKAMLRYALRQQAWSPYDLEPIEFVALNFDFHPRYIADQLAQVGFVTQTTIPTSFFRLNLFKQLLPLSILVRLDALAQRTHWLVSPSVFTRNTLVNSHTMADVIEVDKPEELFICPRTGSDLRRDGDMLISDNGLRWGIRDGIYDFKSPVDG